MRYFSLEELSLSPGRRSGLSANSEARYHKECAIFIHRLCASLSLSPTTMATAQQLFHRFCMAVSLQQVSRLTLATACVFVAGKVAEQPTKLDTLVPAMLALRESRHVSERALKESREKVIGYERLVLQALQFEIETLKIFQPLMDTAKKLSSMGDTAVYWECQRNSLGILLSLTFVHTKRFDLTHVPANSLV
eukprot:m.60550 g.60550  ORF g.60550 m.60550 type:complete len:193 (+) comp11823_c0_seq1:98-676(+)